VDSDLPRRPGHVGQWAAGRNSRTIAKATSR